MTTLTPQSGRIKREPVRVRAARIAQLGVTAAAGGLLCSYGHWVYGVTVMVAGFALSILALP